MYFKQSDFFAGMDHGFVKNIMANAEKMTYQAGQCFGWSSLIDRSRYSASAVCAAPTSLMQLDKTKMRATLKSNPANGLIFMQRLAAMIGERLLLSYRTLGSLAMLASCPTEGTGQVQESLELA